jgi:predicted nucleotidyltransferase
LNLKRENTSDNLNLLSIFVPKDDTSSVNIITEDGDTVKGAVPSFTGFLSLCYSLPMKYGDIRALADRHHIRIVYLFGSQSDSGKRYLEGEAVMPDAVSDLDVAVVFEAPPAEVMKTYGVLYREFSKIFDLFAVDLVSMHEVNTLFQYEIIKGKRIFAEDESFADDFEERIMKIGGDLLFKKRIFDVETMEAMENGYFEFEYIPHS